MKQFITLLLLFISAASFGQIQDINIGTSANDRTGDPIRTAFNKTNLNFDYVDAQATATGTNTYTASISPAITSYVTGQRYLITFTNANTGAATLNLNSLGAKAIKKSGTQALSNGDISAGQIFILLYDGTNMQIVGSGGVSTWATFESIGVLASNTAAQNTTALQAAIDAVATGSKRVFYGSGQYPLNGTIDLKSDIYIVGNFDGSKGNADNTTSRFIITDTSNPVFRLRSRTSIKGFVFDYPNQPLNTTTTASLINYPTTILPQALTLVEQIRLEDLTCVGCSEFIEFTNTQGSQDFTIQNIYGYPLHGAIVNIQYCYDIPYIDLIHVNPGAGRGYRTIDATTGTPCTGQVIDYVIANAAPTVRIANTDEFVSQRIFAFGVKTGMQITDSYGSVVQANMDIVETGWDISIGDDRKAVQLIGCSGIPSGGPTVANRNMIKFGGAGGTLIVDNLNVQLGVNGAVPSSTAAANSIILINGTGDQDIIMSNITGNSTGTFTYDIRRLSASSNLNITNFDVKTSTTTYYAGQGGFKSKFNQHTASNFTTEGLAHFNTSTGTSAHARAHISNQTQFLFLGCTGTGYSGGAGAVPAGTPYVEGYANNLIVKTSTAHDLVLQTNNVEHVRVTSGGAINVTKTITAAGTVGAQTINKLAGTVNFAAGASSVVVTNSLVTTSSLVFPVVRTNDGTALIKNIVPAAGSFTITLNAAATAETSVGFLVIN